MPSLPSDAGETDLVFALVCGLYGSFVVAPVTLFAARSVLTDTASLYIAGLVGGCLVTTVGTVLVRRQDGLAVALGASRRRFLPAVGPGTVVGVAALWFYFLGREPPSLAILLGVLVLFGSLATGGILAVMADTRYTKAVTERSEIFAEWRAPAPRDHQRRVQIAGGAVVACSLVLVVLGALFDHSLARFSGQILLPMGVVALSRGQERHYRATKAGLELVAPGRRHLHDWEQFDGYMITDQALVVHRTAPWRLPLYFDRESLDDVDAVVDAIGRHLPRLPAGDEVF